jgi:hypothetical protein
MTRVWDHISFAIWFAGLGYIVMWLLGAPNHFELPPALHAIGLLAAALIPVRLLLRIVKRRRAVTAVDKCQSAAILRPRRRKATYPVRAVKPRSHFGLRGVPH